MLSYVLARVYNHIVLLYSGCTVAGLRLFHFNMYIFIESVRFVAGTHTVFKSFGSQCVSSVCCMTSFVFLVVEASRNAAGKITKNFSHQTVDTISKIGKSSKPYKNTKTVLKLCKTIHHRTIFETIVQFFKCILFVVVESVRARIM